MKKTLFITIMLFFNSIVGAQTLSPLNYKDYINLVFKQNIEYAAEKLNINIADAEIKAAQVFNDPQLSFEYAYNDDNRIQMGRAYTTELSKTFSLGKRKARMDLARSEKMMNEALLEDYFRNLRAESTLAYLGALKQKELYQVRQNSYENIRRLAQGDSTKFSLGKITRVDAVQSGVEADMMYNELIQAKSELNNCYAVLHLWTGSFHADNLFLPEGALRQDVKSFEVHALLEAALENRADLVAAMKSIDVADKLLKVTKRERRMDFDLALGYNYNTEVLNEIAPAPKFNGITLGIAIPLKFSNLNKGSVRVAQYQLEQAKLHYKQAEIEVQSSLMQHYRQYISLVEQVGHYENGLLKDAKLVLDGKIYSYNRGETSLLEVLNAQRTYNDLRTSYIETLYNFSAALVELERSAGIWDMEIL